jgi:hypothetical protein
MVGWLAEPPPGAGMASPSLGVRDAARLPPSAGRNELGTGELICGMGFEVGKDAGVEETVGGA